MLGTRNAQNYYGDDDFHPSGHMMLIFLAVQNRTAQGDFVTNSLTIFYNLIFLDNFDIIVVVDNFDQC